MELEVYIYLVLAVGSILVCFGSYRRRSNSAFLRLLIMVVFNSSFTLITLIISQMWTRSSSASRHGSFYVIWAAYLLTFHGISDAISAQALEDNEQWSRSALTLFVALFWFYEVLSQPDSPPKSPNSILINVIIVSVSSLPSQFKGRERIEALKKGSKNGLALDTKSVADFMCNDKPAFHNYVVTVKGESSSIDIASEKVITVGKVLSCHGRLLAAGDADSEMKDLCLSFSMYNLLCCHFAGFSPLPRSALDRHWEFFRDVLLHGDVADGENFRRPFRLVEQELGFLYDRFYTKYALLFQKEFQFSKLYYLVCAAASFTVIQYCFLESFHKSPERIYSVFMEYPGKGHVGSYFVPLSPQVQKAVLSWMKQSGGRLTKGRSSLIYNCVRNQELLSFCEFKETTKVIMIWHVATTLCEFQRRKTANSRPLERFAVSVALSKYCAYLVAFAPRLLPDHYVRTNDLFASAVKSAEWMLEGCKSMEDKYTKMMNFAEIAQSLQTDFVTGAGGRVAKLLMEEAGDDEERLWKMLADFWTEMVLFVAPCDDPWPHAEHLAQGGEFVTHLMALLFHAGVAKRDFIEDAAITMV